MNITRHLVPAVDQAKQAAGHAATNAAASLGSAVPTAPSKAPVDVITLSNAAKAAIAASNKTHGKSAESPAHVARDQFMATKIASAASTMDIRFGDVVSRIARGISTESLFGAASKRDGDEDVTKIAAADGKPDAATTKTQDEPIVPTEENTASLVGGAPIAGDKVNIAAIAKSLGDIDILDLILSDKGNSLEAIV